MSATVLNIKNLQVIIDMRIDRLDKINWKAQTGGKLKTDNPEPVCQKLFFTYMKNTKSSFDNHCHTPCNKHYLFKTYLVTR